MPWVTPYRLHVSLAINQLSPIKGFIAGATSAAGFTFLSLASANPSKNAFVSHN